ncbi:AI-2E family transporter [Ramlibacter rhizophilus]|uniref:AI-2E family transporter n=1 Tax=Ramlibacter rhizophilus TaxID=1781167 RepID=A0A4Z0BLR7_9BURK|nr:AI-2E family transporter [Ramlibacter rhizophilus]TFY99701.1 AI-2E family transporter [Ramlibacter rhizophilus]
MNPNDPLRPPLLEHRTLLWLVVGVSAAFAVVLWPFLGAVLWAVFIAIVFRPVHRRVLVQVGGRPNAAALLTLLLILVIVILPLILVSVSIVQEILVVVQKVRTGQIDLGALVRTVFDAVPDWAGNILERFGLDNLQGLLNQLAALLTSSGQAIATRLLGIGQNTLDFVIGLFVMLYVLYFLLRDGSVLVQRVAVAIPLRERQSELLLSQFATVVRATVKGNIVIALVQGSLGGLAFWALGIPGPLLWGGVMALASLIPAVGAALVWAPVAIYLLSTNQLFQGIALAAWGGIAIGLVDNFLRPILVGKDTRMPDYLVLVSTLGGLAMFGINGFVMGPVIAAMFLVTWNMLTALRQQHTSPEE